MSFRVHTLKGSVEYFTQTFPEAERAVADYYTWLFGGSRRATYLGDVRTFRAGGLITFEWRIYLSDEARDAKSDMCAIITGNDARPMEEA